MILEEDKPTKVKPVLKIPVNNCKKFWMSVEAYFNFFVYIQQVEL